MNKFTKDQSKLAATITAELQKSGCDVGQCIQVLSLHLAGLIGVHAPSVVDIQRFCVALGKEITQRAIAFHNEPDIVPGK